MATLISTPCSAAGIIFSSSGDETGDKSRTFLGDWNIETINMFIVQWHCLATAERESQWMQFRMEQGGKFQSSPLLPLSILP